MTVDDTGSSLRPVIFGLAVITAALTTACAPEPICAPGVTQECACPAGAKGSQACRTGGDGWSDSACPKIEAVVPPVCSAGATQACACADGRTGAQTCDSEGKRWDACACIAAEAVPVTHDTQAPQAPKTVGELANKKLGLGGVGLRGTGRGAPVVSPVGPQPYSIEIVNAVLGPSAAGGAKWDPMGDGPDVFAVVIVQGAGAGRVQTTVVRDSTRPVWRQRGTVTINVGDEIVVRLADKDALADDDIAVFRERFDGPRKYRFANPARSVESLEVVITLAPVQP